MNIYVEIPGDPSVGIPHETLKAEIGLEDFEHLAEEDRKQERESIRRSFKNLYSFIHDNYAHVWFEDECPDCGKLKRKCDCIV